MDMFFYLENMCNKHVLNPVCKNRLILPPVCPQLWNQSVNFGRHLTEILSPFEISYQIFIHTLSYLYLSFRNLPYQNCPFRNLTLATNFFFQMLGNFTLLRSLSTDSMVTWPNDDVNCRSAVNKTKEASHWTCTRMISKLWSQFIVRPTHSIATMKTNKGDTPIQIDVTQFNCTKLLC